MSTEYEKLRSELRLAEMALRDQRERVAELRRALPTDRVMDDYEFVEGPEDLYAGDAPTRTVRLSELFTNPEQSLILVHFMFGKKQTNPCPLCTMWADGYTAVADHISQRNNFGIVVAGDIAEFRAFARERGWKSVRLLSAADSTFKLDLGAEDDEGNQFPAVSVLTRDAGGAVRHFYTGGAVFGEGEYRGMDLLSPVWNFFDLTPEGRGDWYPSLSYD